MTATYPLPRETRQTAIESGDGVSSTYGPFGFKIFDTADVAVFTKAEGDARFALDGTVTVTKTAAAALDTFSVTFAAALPATTDFIVIGLRTHERSTDATIDGIVRALALELELSKQGAVMQELRRDLDRALTPDFDVAALKRLPAPVAGRLLIANEDGDGYENGPDASDIADAQANAAIASTAAAAAAAVATGVYPTAAAVKALDTSAIARVIYDGSQWNFTAGDFSTKVAADTVGALYLKADDTAAADGAWLRQIDGMPTIEMFGIAGDGSDESTAVKTAHDVASALGIRELWCAGTYSAPTAYNLGNVLFRGPGSINAYRKHIVPLSAKSVSSFGPGVIPSLHLKTFSRAVSPVVMIVGDSTATNGGGQVSQTQSLWSIIQRAIHRDNPGKDITFLNRAIAGTAIGNFQQTGDTLSGSFTLPSWFTPTTDTWSERAEAAEPDLVIVVFGENDPNGTTITRIKTLVDDLQGYAKVPDIVLCTNIGRSTQYDSGSAEYDALRYRDQVAGALRSYAYFAGLGLMDFHRLGCMMRDGFDPCEQIMTRDTSVEVSTALPATLTLTQSDFSLAFTIDNTSDAAFGSGQLLDVKLSAIAGNVLRFAKSGSNFVLLNYSGSAPSYNMLGTIVTSIVVPTTPLTIEVSIRRSWAWIWIAGTLAYEGPVLRHGSFFQPTVSYGSGSGPANITVTKYVASQPLLVVPALTDEEMFGVSPFLTGGNGINHPASAAFAKIRAAITDRIDFAAHGQPVQQIAAAGAIDPDARAVEITGPASSTYAITLAAPRPEDAGRMLPIEMVGTTGSNAVTLALTNITGGSAASSASFDAAGEKLILVGGDTSWEVIKESGVTLT